MIPLLKSAVCGLSSTSRAVGCGGVLQNYATMLTSGLKTYSPLPDYSDVVIPERTKLKFMDKVPTLKKVRREMKRLKDIVGPEQRENSFTSGQYGIVAMGGGYLHWGHMEMMRLTINRRIDPRVAYALWRINAPYKPITSKGLGKRMGGGKGAVDHYVTPIRCGRLLVELGGRCELGEVKGLLTEVAKKLPFPAKVVSRESLAEMQQAAAARELNNQNPWTFSRIAAANMLGIRKVLSPVDLRHHGRYTGKFHLPERV